MRLQSIARPTAENAADFSLRCKARSISSEATVKDVSIVGLGNIMKGDFGIGCYVVPALNQEPLGDAIDVSYLAEGYSYLNAYFTKLSLG